MLNELAKLVIHHRTTEFEELFARSLKNLKAFSNRTAPFTLTATGTGAMGPRSSTLPRAARGFSPSSPKIRSRWHEMAQTLGYRSVPFEIPWGEDIDLDYFKNALRPRDAEAILCQA